MKILFVANSFYPNIGGVEKHVLSLSSELQKMGHSITVLTPKKKGYPEYDQHNEIRIIRFRRKKCKLSVWRSLYQYKKNIKQSNIIHLHDYTPFLWLFPFLLLYQKKFFITFHGWEGKVPPSTITKFLRKNIERISSGSIAIGHFISKWYQQKPTKILYGGVSQEEIREPGNINTLSPNFLFYGRLSYDTEIEEYLKFFKLFFENNNTSTLTIVGNGPIKNQLKEYSQNNKLPCTFVDQTDIITPFIKKSDIIFTGGYLGILEALANGKLVCALYSNPLKKDYLEQSIFKDKILIAGNISELNVLLKKYLSNRSKLDKLLSANHNFIVKQTWSEISSQYLDLWK